MPNQKRIFIIHGWGGSPDTEWLPWLAEKLRTEGFLVEVPEMPDTDYPKIETWVGYLKNIVGGCDANTFFVGHSIGCQAIMRYLEKLPDDEKCGGPARIATRSVAGGAVFVAGWITLTGLNSNEERFISSPWVNVPIDFEKVKKRVDKIICIFSDNDPYVPAENWDMFSKNLGVEIIVEKNKGHFTDEDGVKELPSALEAILEIAG